MKEIKLIFIALEIAMIIGLILVVFLVDWTAAEVTGVSILYKVMILLLALNAMLFQHEQDSIKWNEE